MHDASLPHAARAPRAHAARARNPTQFEPQTAMQRPALLGIVSGTVALTLAYASAFLPGGTPQWAPWLFVVGLTVLLVSTMALGAGHREGQRGLRILWGLLVVILLGGFGGALALPANEGPSSALWLGLPLRAALVIYLVGLVPVLLVPIFYAKTFHRLTLRPGDLERVREAALLARSEGDPPPQPEGRPPVLQQHPAASDAP